MAAQPRSKLSGNTSDKRGWCRVVQTSAPVNISVTSVENCAYRGVNPTQQASHIGSG
jgi:hypothetical protein